MKNLKWLFFGFIALFFAACSTDPCDGIACQNDGYCEDGSCICPPYYCGEFCEKEWRDLFVGEYQGTTTYEGIESYDGVFHISKTLVDPSKLQTSMGEFVLESQTRFSIPQQGLQFGDGSTYSIAGSGFLQGDQLTFIFTLTDPGSGDSTVGEFQGTKSS